AQKYEGPCAEIRDLAPDEPLGAEQSGDFKSGFVEPQATRAGQKHAYAQNAADPGKRGSEGHVDVNPLASSIEKTDISARNGGACRGYRDTPPFETRRRENDWSGKLPGQIIVVVGLNVGHVRFPWSPLCRQSGRPVVKQT